MRAWLARQFPAWTDFCEYMAIMSACVAGIAGAPAWLAVIGAAMALSLLGWSRWRDVVGRAAKVDAEWRKLGGMLRPFEPWQALKLYARGHTVLVVVGAHMLNNCFFSGLAYVFGIACGWLWGVP